MRKKIAVIAFAGTLLFGLAGCAGRDSTHNSGYIDEWISPDGVHYWRDTTGNNGYMVPRYDHEGNLVIDNWDIQ